MPNATKRKTEEREMSEIVLDQPVEASVEFAQRKKETKEREFSTE